MNSFRKYLWVAVTSARSNFAYLSDVSARIIFLTVILYIFLRLWRVTYGEMHTDRLAGLSITQMLWYLAVTESILMSGPRIAQLVDEDVRTGALAVQLVRPMSYPGYRLASNFGERAVRFAVNMCAASAVTFVLAGPLHVSLQSIAFFAVVVPLAFLLDFLGNFAVGLGAFWLEDTTGLVLLYSRGVMIFGGMLIPLELYPQSWQPVLRALPFSNIAYGPAHLFVNPTWNDFQSILARQVVAVMVLGLIVFCIYRFALRRVFVNGG